MIFGEITQTHRQIRSSQAANSNYHLTRLKIMLETVNYERFLDNMYRNAAWKLERQLKILDVLWNFCHATLLENKRERS